MEKSFSRNIPTISESEQQLLGDRRAAIIGCGGLGGYAVELLARAGVGKFTLADGDVFEETNLNRQILSLPELLGKSKARAAAERIRAINAAAEIRCCEEFFGEDSADRILEGADIVIDALDNIPARLLLEEKCAEKGLWFIHGAVEGFALQVCAVSPGSGTLKKLYGGAGVQGSKSVLSPTPAMCASLQCAEALKILCGRDCALENRLLIGDMRNMDFVTMELG